MNKIKLVCFDLNKTLINENSWRDLNLGMGILPEEDDMFMNWSKQGVITDKVAQQLILNLYKRSGKHNYKNILKILSNYTYKDGAKELIQNLKGKGYQLAIISGSMDILVERIALELGITLQKSNNLFVFDESDYLKDIITIDNDYRTKLFQLKSICKELEIELENCVCVGDGDNDKDIFIATKHGITFTGSKIEKDAWKTVSDLTEISDIL